MNMMISYQELVRTFPRSPGYTAFFNANVGVLQGRLPELSAVYTAIVSSVRDENVIPNCIGLHPSKLV